MQICIFLYYHEKWLLFPDTISLKCIMYVSELLDRTQLIGLSLIRMSYFLVHLDYVFFLDVVLIVYL